MFAQIDRHTGRRITLEDRRLFTRLAAQIRARRGGPERGAALFVDACLRRLAGEEARCRLSLGGLLEVFRRKGRFTRLGFARLGDYSRERLGISGSEAETAARVSAGLRRLPLLADAFRSGLISWTKARILVAVATPDNEERWLAAARDATVRELEDVVRKRDAGTSAARELAAVSEDDGETVDGEPRVRLRVACPRWVWLLFRRVVELARRAAGEELPVWKAVEAIAAEGVTGAPRDPSSDEVRLEAMPIRFPRRRRASFPAASPGTGISSNDDDGSLASGPPPEVAARLGLTDGELRELMPEPDGDDGECDESLLPAEFDRRMRAAVRRMQRIDWKVGRLLALVVSHRLEHELGFACLEDYVRERLGISIRKARALIALERASRRCSSLAAAYPAGELSWVRAMVLLPVLRDGRDPAREVTSPESANAWVERAGQVTVRRLSDEVGWTLEQAAASRPGQVPAAAAASSSMPPPLDAPLEPVEVGVQMRVEESAPSGSLPSAFIEFSAPASVATMFRTAVTAWCEPDEPLWKGLLRLLLHAGVEWSRNGKHPDPVFARDGWRCQVPGCSSRRNLHDHHKDFRSRGGSNALDNRLVTCAAHHLNGIHAGRIRVTGTAPDGLFWELGVCSRPGGAPLLRLRGETYLEAPPW